VLCTGGPSLSSKIIQNCGADPFRCIAKGLKDQPQMSAILKRDRGSFDNAALKKKIVEGALNMIRKHPGIGALLLECSDMPPYAA